MQGECVSKRIGSQTMENVALENNIITSMDSQGSSTSKSIAIFLTMDWIGLFIGKLQITAKVWLQLKELSNSFSLSARMSLSPESKYWYWKASVEYNRKGTEQNAPMLDYPVLTRRIFVRRCYYDF